jgi:hypothetical protein
MKALKFTLTTALLVVAVLAAEPASAQTKPPTKTIRGTIFRDTNGNGRLDSREKGGVASTIWLYRVMPNGTRRKVRQVRTDAVGNYTLANLPHGRYFLGIRYNNSKFAVRTGVFVVGPKTGGVARNIPLVTPQTINRYPSLAQVPNPANLDRQAPVSPFSPGT